MSSAPWGYSELNSWSQEHSSSHHHQQQELLLSPSKRPRRDQECGSLWSLRVPTSDLDGGTMPVVPVSAFQGEEGGGLRSRESDLGESRFYMDDTSFLDSDGAVSSSCHFALSDVEVGARIGLFSQAAQSHKENLMEESWEAINNLGDMDDIFGNTSSFAQVPSLEPSLSSQAPVTAGTGTVSPPAPSESSSVIMLNSTLGLHQLAPAVNDCGRELGDFRSNNNLQMNNLDVKVSLPVKTPVFGFDQQKHQVSRRLESYYPAPLALPPLQPPLTRQPHQQQVESGYQGVNFQGDGLLQAWNERRETNSSATTCANEASTSLEAAVFYQLASTMTKLDVGTRLSIRNALYRLAKGASSRNRDENGMVYKYPSRDPEMACLETCTNPIDRTVASLLFYKHEQTQQAVNVAQQQQQQQDTSSGSVSPNSAISSNSCVTQLRGPELKLSRTSLAPPRSEVPRVVVQSNGAVPGGVLGNKLPLPPLRYSRNNRRLGH